MKKEADVLSAAGHDVHVLYAFRTTWASAADRLIFENCNWTHELIGGDPEQHPWAYHFSRKRNGMNGLGIRRGPPVGAFGASSLPSNAMPLIS